jgi:hypothetical protein
MHVDRFLHKLLGHVTHFKRLVTIIYLVKATIKVRELSVTRLGRGLDLPIQERSCIRRSDRLIGNKKLHKERIEIYREEIKLFLGNKEKCNVLVDWSQIPNTTHNVLRASLALRGGALTIYEEVHPEKLLGNAKVQKDFLKNMYELIPSKCKVVIVTDAGFGNSWFRYVQKLGWDYVGRVRGIKNYRGAESKGWEKISSLWSKACSIAKSIGEIELCRVNTLITFLYLFKGKAKGRKGKGTTSKQLRGAREPWVLVSSLKGRLAAKQVVKIYKQRMQIEEGFRSLKSSYYGFGFEKAYSRSIARIEVLLLIAMLASLVAWLTGWVVERNKLHCQFQVNTMGNRRVLSLFFLGCRAIKRKLKISIAALAAAIKSEDIYAI